MTTSSIPAVFLALAVAACGGGQPRPDPPPQELGPAPQPTCVVPEPEGIEPELARRLAAAGNIVAYQEVWQTANPGATLGSVEHAVLRARIRARNPEVRRCYEAAMGRIADGQMRVVLRFVIDGAGGVRHVTVPERDVSDAEVACCLATRLLSWTFPPPAEGDFLVVEYPFSVRITGSR